MSSDSMESAVEYLTSKEGFNCEEMLGKGTYGVVIKISKKESGNMAAKIVENRVVNLLEIEEWSRLKHGNVLRLVDTLLGLDGVVIFLTDLMDTNLFRRLQNKQFRMDPLAPERCRIYARQVISGLAYLHQLDLCHLDLRAENVFIGFDDRAVVADFSGMCRATDMKKFCPLPNSLRPPEMLGVKKMVEPMPIDLWSYGLLIAHLYLGKGFFECTVRHKKAGNLEAAVQYTGYFQTQAYVEKFFSETYPNSKVSRARLQELMEFVKHFLQFDPMHRMRAEEAMRSSFLNTFFYEVPTVAPVDSIMTRGVLQDEVLVPLQQKMNKMSENHILDILEVINEDISVNEGADGTKKKIKKKPWIRIGRIKIYMPFPFSTKPNKPKTEEKPAKKNKPFKFFI